MVYGVWVGRNLNNDTHMIVTEGGRLVRNRSLKHLSISEEWGLQTKKILLNLTWTPWEQLPEHKRARRPAVDVPDMPDGRPVHVKDPPAGWQPTKKCSG